MQQACNVPSPELFGICLSDLRPTELMQLRKSIDIFNEREEEFENKYLNPSQNNNINVTGEPQPTAMALMAEARGAVWENEEMWPAEEKASKLQTFFRISITALAFLSFGGYLLCMIVQAIRSKGATFFYPVVSSATTYLGNGVRGIKVYRRGR